MAFVNPMHVSVNSFTTTRSPLVRSLKSPENRHIRSPTTRRATTRMIASQEERISAAKLDWENLGFQYFNTGCFVQMTWKDGSWSPFTLTEDPYIKTHIAATALHYGQSCFEGLKAFRGKDDQIRIFRPDQNAKRMMSSADRLMIPQVPQHLFLDAVHTAVRENAAFVPPYGTGGSLYIRPLLFGSGARMGLQTADEFTFLVLVVPVGDYYKGGLSPVTAIVMDEYDRAAPRGVGNVKVAGNYAADLLPNSIGKSAGYPINLYLDARNRRTVEEFGTANFIGIIGDTYVTPNSQSVLPSITNKTLMQLAKDKGMEVQQREIDISEVRDMDEVAACGTAVVITAVTRLLFKDELIPIGNPDAVGPKLRSLYEEVRALQYAEMEDVHGFAHTLRLQ